MSLFKVGAASATAFPALLLSSNLVRYESSYLKLKKHWSSGCTSNCALFPQLLVFPVMSQLMYSASLIGGQSAGDPAMEPNLTLPWQQALMDIGMCVSPTPPPALGVTCTVEKNTLLW